MKNFKLNSKVEIAPLINPVKLSINITQMNVFCQVGSPIVSCQLMALCVPLLSMPNILCITYKLFKIIAIFNVASIYYSNEEKPDYLNYANTLFVCHVMSLGLPVVRRP